MQKTELNFVLQGNYGYGWETLVEYPCGVRQHNYAKAYKEARADYTAYRQNETQYRHRLITKYLPIFLDNNRQLGLGGVK